MVFYMNLTADEVRDALSGAFSGANRGADATLVESFLEEQQSWVASKIGGLPNSDKVMRGILRDLAASRTMLKLAAEEEDRRAAVTLRDDALARLKSYEKNSPSGAGAKIFNLTPAPLWDCPEFEDHR